MNGDFASVRLREKRSGRQDDTPDIVCQRGNVHVAGCPRPVLAFAAVACGLALLFTGSGCAFGPLALEKTHWRYNEAVRRVDEEQLLRNIVRMRYNESTLDLNVSSIAAQYELDGAAEARPFFVSPNPSNSNVIFRTFTKILPDVSLSGATRPTITLVPGDTGDAVQRFLTPISLDTLVFLFQTSWPVSTVMRLWVDRANGVPNASAASGPPQQIPPDFARFRRIAELCQEARVEKLGTIHPDEQIVELGSTLPEGSVDAHAMVEAAKNGLEYHHRADGTWSLIRKERRLLLDVNLAAVDHPVMQELATLLNMRPGLPRYEIVIAPGIVADPFLFPGGAPSRRGAQHAVHGSGVLLPVQRRRGAIRASGLWSRDLARWPGRRDIRQPGGDRRPVHGSLREGSQATEDGISCREGARVLVLYR